MAIDFFKKRPKKSKATLLSLVDKESSSHTTALEAKINQLVYEFYGLTEEEIGIVKNS